MRSENEDAAEKNSIFSIAPCYGNGAVSGFGSFGGLEKMVCVFPKEKTPARTIMKDEMGHVFASREKVNKRILWFEKKGVRHHEKV